MTNLFQGLKSFCLCIGVLWMSGCTGVTETRLTASPNRAPITKKLVVLIDSDVISVAFASYKGTAPFASRSADYQGFIDNLVASTHREAEASGLDAKVEVLSLKTLRANAPFPSSGEPVLVIKALSFTRRVETISRHDLGWNGDTEWDFSLSEKVAGNPYKQTWAAGTKHENLNPFLCGSYGDCSKAFVGRVFAQMRKDGVVR